MPQFREYNFNTVECKRVQIEYGDKWLEALLSRDEMIDKCIASIKTIENTINE